MIYFPDFSLFSTDATQQTNNYTIDISMLNVHMSTNPPDSDYAHSWYLLGNVHRVE